MMKITDSSDGGGGCLCGLGLHTPITGQSALDAHPCQNIHQTLKPGLSNDFNLHGIHAKRDKEIDAHGKKTPKKDITITVMRRTFYLSKISHTYMHAYTYASCSARSGLKSVRVFQLSARWLWARHSKHRREMLVVPVQSKSNHGDPSPGLDNPPKKPT